MPTWKVLTQPGRLYSRRNQGLIPVHVIVSESGSTTRSIRRKLEGVLEHHTVQPRQATHSKRKPPLSRAVSHGAMDQLPGMESEWRRNLKLGRIQRQAQVEPGARHVLADALGHTPEQGFLAWFTE